MKPKSWDVPGKGLGITQDRDENLTKLVLLPGLQRGANTHLQKEPKPNTHSSGGASVWLAAQKEAKIHFALKC